MSCSSSAARRTLDRGPWSCFLVLTGGAEKSLRRLLYNDVVVFRVGEESPGVVDTLTGCVRNIINKGDCELVSIFLAEQRLDPDRTDLYPERVEVSAP